MSSKTTLIQIYDIEDRARTLSRQGRGGRSGSKWEVSSQYVGEEPELRDVVKQSSREGVGDVSG